MSQVKRIITHNGNFHCDEVFAVAALKLHLTARKEVFEIIRTRDTDVIEGGDIVVDVGGLYEPDAEKFDHHQEGGAGKRDNGVPYASFGLVWKKYGELLCGSAKVADAIDQKLVQSIDAMDNGIDVYRPVLLDVQPYLLSDFLESFGLTWKERGIDLITVFLSVVDMATSVLEREIKRAIDEEEGRSFVEEAYQNAEDKRVIVLDDNYPATDVLNKHPEPLYVIKPRFDDNVWMALTIRDDSRSFTNRKSFPAAWGGKSGAELASITGVEGSMFCHNGRFIMVAKTREAAIRLATIAADHS